MKVCREWTEVPVCPHCGQKDTDWWDGSKLNGDGDTEEMACAICGGLYEVRMCIETSFCTKPLAANGKEEAEDE